MNPNPVFLSIVIALRNGEASAPSYLAAASETAARVAIDYEIIIVDNASEDGTLSVLRGLIGEQGLPNIQVFALTREVDADTAAWVGAENAIGDFIAVVDPTSDDIEYLPTLLEKALRGADVVFARNRTKPRTSMTYRAASAIFHAAFKVFSGIDLKKQAPKYRLLSRRVVNFILQHPQPALSYRHLPASAGFVRANLEYDAPASRERRARLSDSVDRGMRLIVSTTRTPMRVVTSLSLFGAIANVLYSVYVLFIALFKDDVEPGWVSLSFQQSGMFFLISLVLLVLGEYILQMASLSNEGPLYHVAQEFRSARMTRQEKLNVESLGRGPAKAVAE